MNHDLERRIAIARMAEQSAQHRKDQRNAEQQQQIAHHAVDGDIMTRHLGELFSDVFARPVPLPTPAARPEIQQESPFAVEMRLAELDPEQRKNPPVPLQWQQATIHLPEPAVPPSPMEARAAEASPGDALAEVESRLSFIAEAVTPSPDVAVRRAYRDLPGEQRNFLTTRIEAEDFMPGYFTARGFDQDYLSVLIGAALASRLKDAQRLDPGMTPDALLQTLLALNP